MTDRSHYRYQVLKNGLPVLMCPTIEIAEAYYLQYGCDEIRTIEDEKENDMKTKGTVYLLEEDYKDNGPEIVGIRSELSEHGALE